MDPNTRAELDSLKREQASLEQRLERVGMALMHEESRVRAAATSLENLRQEQTLLQSDSRTLLQRIESLVSEASSESIQEEHHAAPPPLPPIIPEPVYAAAPPEAVFSSTQKAAPSLTGEAPATINTSKKNPPSATPNPVPIAEPAQSSFEMRLGTYWLVRIGIVMLLGGMVFLGNYAYKYYIGNFGPAGKISLLYLASGALLALGSWLPRKQPKLKNYAEVLFAGGLAAVYFTTYAAHHLPTLLVIKSAVLDGALLLGWAGFMVWLATRKQSETLALFAVGLGYYTSIITNVGLFTLYSNVVLTAAAVFFLVRNRWATLTFGSLFATYVSYGFWRFYHGGGWHWATPEEGLWTGVYFLMCYWALFTAAVFLSRHDQFKGSNRTAFLSLNNGAFFFLFLLTMLQVRQGGFYKFGLAYGTALLVLAVLASLFLKQDRTAANAYLAQGLLLVTLGFITYYSGLQLGLVLAVESVALYVLSSMIRSRIMLAGSITAGFLGAFWTLGTLHSQDRSDLYLGCGVTALLLVNNLVKQRGDFPSQKAAGWARGFFAIAASAVLLRTTWEFAPEHLRTVILSLEGLCLTMSWYAVRSRELAFAGQAFVAFGQFVCLAHLAENLSIGGTASWPWWNPVAVGAISLGLSHWWQRQKQLTLPANLITTLQIIFGLALVGLLYCGLKPSFEPPYWLMLTSFLALGITIYGLGTRLWVLAGVGQLFMLASCFEFVHQIYVSPMREGPGWTQALVPIGTLMALGWVCARIWSRSAATAEENGPAIKALSRLYVWAAFAMAIGWVFEFIPMQERFWFLTVAGLLLFIASGLRKNATVLLFGGCFTGVAFVYFWAHFWDETIIYWPNAFAVVLLLAQQQLAKRQSARFALPQGIHAVSIVVGTCSLALLLSKWVLLQAGGFYLTVAWGFLALLLFNAGFLLRERVYRWAGLALLGLGLGRVDPLRSLEARNYLPDFQLHGPGDRAPGPRLHLQ